MTKWNPQNPNTDRWGRPASNTYISLILGLGSMLGFLLALGLACS